MRFPPKEAIAVLIMSSQKTMPFAVSIIALLPASLGSKGLLTLPPLVAQVSYHIGEPTRKAFQAPYKHCDV